MDGENQSYFTAQNPVFAIDKPSMGHWNPQKIETWEQAFPNEIDFNAEYPLKRADMDSNRQVMVTFAGFAFPLAPDQTLSDDEMNYIGTAFEEECEQLARYAASEEVLGFGARKVVYIGLMCVVLVIALLVGLTLAPTAIQNLNSGV